MPNVSNVVGSAQCKSSQAISTGVPSATSISQATIASRVAPRCCCAVIERRGKRQGLEAAKPGFEPRQMLRRGVLRLPAEHALQMFDDRMECARRVKRGT